MSEEIWKPVVGREDCYLVSSLGRVWSLMADVEMSLWVNQDGYDQVGLRGRGNRKQRLVHRLVCEAFHGPAPEGKPLSLHGVGGIRDNTPGNLRWGSNSDNMRDRILHGTDTQRNKTHCPQGHPYDGENTRWVSSSSGTLNRSCKKCGLDRQRRDREKGISENSPYHGVVSGYTRFGCRCGPCKKAYSDYGKRWRSGKSKIKR